ncbi:MAG: c-type cytochrome [Sandaracinaceae bacterium]|nr:c-type cytochrome [Sandaracinaceae bacterium]
MRPVLLTATLLAGCGASAPHAAPPPSSEGAALYAQYCALCHGADGEGYAADDATRLRGQRFLTTATDDLLAVAIARGRPHTAMAGYSDQFGGPLTDAQIDALVAFVRGWQVEPTVALDATPLEGDAENGAELFARECASCHGQLGNGGRGAQSLNRWTFLSQASDAFLRYAIEHGREETPMPAFAGRLSAQEIADVVVFLRRFEEEPDVVPRFMAPPRLEDMTVVRHEGGPRPQFELREGRFVSAAQVRDAVAAQARLILLDARPTSDWLVARLPGALPVPYYDIEPILARLPRDGTWIVAYCGCPHTASGEVVDRLRAAGFEHTAVLDEGVFHWIDAGYPTEEGPLPAARAQ